MAFATLKNHKWVESHALKDQEGQVGVKSGPSRDQDRVQDGDMKIMEVVNKNRRAVR